MKNIYEAQYVKNLFNQMSGSYERMNYITSFGFSIRWRKQFINQMGKSDAPLQVIDLLSGLGENWSYLKKSFPNAHFSALDFSEKMIASSRPKAQKIFQENINLYCENMLSSPLESNKYDIVSCAFGLKTFNQEQLEILAQEIHRILKPEGKFSFIEVSVPSNPILYFFYSLYLKYLIPLLGKLFLGNPQDYKMLWVYTELFQNCDRLKSIFKTQNLSIESKKYFWGCATGICGTKI